MITERASYEPRDSASTSERVEVKKIKVVIKSIMKKQRLQYKDLAKALDLSVPTINRILNKDDLSLERLYDILEWLGVTLFDVIEISKDLNATITEHTVEQEEFLARNPQHLLVYEYLRDGGYTLDYIRSKYRIQRGVLEKCLYDLERQNLIELYPNGKVKPLINHLRWRHGGALRKTFGPKLGKLFGEVTRKAVMKRHEMEDPTTQHRGSLGILMREETFEKMKEDIDELEKKYRTLSKTEVPLERKENLKWVIYSFLAAQRDIRDDLYEKPRDFTVRT